MDVIPSMPSGSIADFGQSAFQSVKLSGQAVIKLGPDVFIPFHGLLLRAQSGY